MRLNRKHDLKRSQQSVFWYDTAETMADPRISKRTDYYHHSYTSMLIDDVRNALIPTPNHTERSFDINLNPTDEAAERIVIDAIDRRDLGSDLTDALWDFMEECAAAVIVNEEAFYEITYYLDGDGKKVAFYLSYIPAGTVLHDGDKLKQYVPESIAKERELSGQYFDLSSERILIFTLPRYVQSGFGEMMAFLAKESENLFPKFFMDDLHNMSNPRSGNNRTPFDQAKFIRTQKMALAEATKLIGYNFRDYSMEYVTEYYYLHRELLLERFKVELRNSILATLNEGVIRAGKELGFNGQIEILGLPTIEDVITAQTKLSKGNGTFDEIMKPFKYY